MKVDNSVKNLSSCVTFWELTRLRDVVLLVMIGCTNWICMSEILTRNIPDVTSTVLCTFMIDSEDRWKGRLKHWITKVHNSYKSSRLVISAVNVYYYHLCLVAIFHVDWHQQTFLRFFVHVLVAPLTRCEVWLKSVSYTHLTLPTILRV